MAKTKTTKRKGPNTMTLPPGHWPPMPAGKRMSDVTTTKNTKKTKKTKATKRKGNVKVKILLDKEKRLCKGQ